MSKSATNAGVTATTGFGLQKCVAIFCLLEEYQYFKGRKYSIFMEHHDDVVFCFFTTDDKIQELRALQSKKNSKQWSINAELAEIINKLLFTGSNLDNDKSVHKANDYRKALIFASNQFLNLSTKGKGAVTKRINEECVHCSYRDLPDKIQKKILDKLGTAAPINELDYLSFNYMDLPSTIKGQKETLSGKLQSLFGTAIIDHAAAIDTIIHLLEKAEHTYNQNKEAKLVDKTKQVTHIEIEDVFNLCKSKAKSFDYWRKQAVTISTALSIYPREKESFEENFRNAFDYFKSKEQAEHLRILDFVEKNYQRHEEITEVDSIQKLFNAFIASTSSPLEDLALKAIIYAAYFEVTYKKEA
jgi:hypothetical protein